jgi:phosphoribosylcarboxyaminoimidazole (NCAIR) mutase
MDSGTAANLYSVWGVDAGNIFAVGESGSIVHYDGTSWSAMTSGTMANLYGVWGTDSTNVFVVGQSGTVLRYDGTSWSAMTSGTAADLYSIWGIDGNNIFAVGQSGSIVRYDGTSWSAMTSGTAADLYGVWGVDSTHIFAVGESGTVLRYNGTSWSVMTSGTAADLYGVWGADSAHIFAVGESGAVLRYDGTSWSVITSGTAADLYSVWGADSTHVFAAGQSGVILSFDGFDFSSMNRNAINDLRSVWGVSYSDIFISGDSGTILRYFPPTISSISPDRGYQGETLDITLTGSNFTGASEVQFGTGISVNSFTVVSSSRIDASITIMADALVGTRDISVTTPGGSYTLPDGFTVKQALPVITSVSPGSGNQETTLDVTLTGSNFTGASGVQFGAGISVNSFTVVSSSRIDASITIADDADTGTRNVSVTTPGGSYTLPGGFTVKQALPLITSMEPGNGRQGETLNIAISGTNFTGATDVQFGSGISVNNFTVVSSSRIDAGITIADDAATGTRNVSVTTPGGSYTLPGGFTVKQALPLITSMGPDDGRQGETLNITITGSSFTGASEVQFGAGISVNSFAVLSANQIAVNITITADAAAGTRDVSITTPGGIYTLPGGFTVKQALPVITSVSPDSGNQGATLDVIVNGSNLSGATSVSFGDGIEVTGFTDISTTQLRVNLTVSSDAAVGARDVSVTTPGGSFILPGSFMIKQKLPMITSISIESGNQGATLNITISGSDFTGVSDVQFGDGISVNSFTVVSSSRIDANITILAGAAAGTRDVSVTTPGGSCTLPGGFTVKQALPVITSISPGIGNQGVTLDVIVNGSNLSGATSVSFGDGIDVISFSNISPTQLRVNVAISSDAVVGLRDILITTPGGSTTFAKGFSIEVESQNTLALVFIWTGIAVVFILLTIILNKLRQKRVSRL